MPNFQEGTKRTEEMKTPKTGILIYKAPVRIGDIITKRKLQQFFPNRDLYVQMAIDPRRPHLYPHDYGLQLGDIFYGEIPQLDYNNYQAPRLPQVVDTSYSIAGGKCVFVPHTKIVFYCGKNAGVLMNLNYQAIDAGPVNEAAEAYRHKLGNYPIREAEYWDLSKYHIDLLMAGVKVPNKGVKVYMHEGVYDELTRGKPHYLEQMQEQAINLLPFPKELAEQGGLNIPYIDGKVLVPTNKVIGPLLDDYDQSGITVCPLGEEQFNIFDAAGVKCRSLVLDYIN